MQRDIGFEVLQDDEAPARVILSAHSEVDGFHRSWTGNCPAHGVDTTRELR
jgi:hypothetical protein